MLDIKFIRENPEIVQKAIDDKQKSAQINIYDILKLDKDKMALDQKLQELYQRRKDNAKIRNKEEGLSIKSDIIKLEINLKEISDKLMKLLLKVPNIPLKEVPIGIDDTENIVLKTVGEIPEFNFNPKSHEELGNNLNIINIEKATKVTKSRFNYLIGDGALLEYALVNYAISVLTNENIINNIIKEKGLNISSKPFIPVIPPNFINSETLLKMARLEPKEDRYYLESEDLYLIGSGEHTLGPIHMGETIDEKDLPIRYFTNTSCYRKEAGSYGRDTKGILRQHQFNKVEMLSYSSPDTSYEEHELFVGIQEYLVKSLGLPYQVVLLCTGDMGTPNAKHVDIETWIPSQNKYRETHSADYNTDYQSRRLNIKAIKNNEKRLIHINDGTGYALGRMIIAILENYQQKDGSIIIPEALRPYMRKDKIEKRKN